MARYNRDFLVPYLQNICALHLAYRKLGEKIDQYDSSIRKCRDGKYNPIPDKPYHRKPITFGRLLSIATGAFLLFGSLGVFTLGGEGASLGLIIFMILCFPVLGTVFLICTYALIKDDLVHNQKEKEKYELMLLQYKETKQSNADLKKQIPRFQNDRQKLIFERNNTQNILNRVYNANIIPRQYRNIYAAVYLYDWFSTSRMDDLDMALNTFVLEEIKEKLDIIIENQSEMILNQCMIAANQRKSLTQQQQHADRLYAKLDQISSSAEERNCYLSMIESNTAATAYFSAANYIQNL